jgi:hypothetical protein
VSTWKVILATLVIFTAGFLAGGALSSKLNFPGQEPKDSAPFQPWEVREEYVSRLVRDLGLTEAQKTEISQTVNESQHRIKILFELVGPEMREEMEQVRESIRGMLTPEQQAAFDELRKKRHPSRRRSSRHVEGDSPRRSGDRPPPSGEGRPLPPPPAPDN